MCVFALQIAIAQQTKQVDLEEFNPDESELFDMSEGEVLNPYLSDGNQRAIKAAISDYMNDFNSIRGSYIGEKETGVSKITGNGSGIRQYKTIAQIENAVGCFVEGNYYTATLIQTNDLETAKMHYTQMVEAILTAVKDIRGSDLIGQELKNKAGQDGLYSQKYFWVDVSGLDFFRDILVQVNLFETPVYTDNNQKSSTYDVTFSVGKYEFN